MSKEQSKLDKNEEERARMLEIYEQSPYPQKVADARNRAIPLLEHWINGLHGFSKPVLHATSSILVAGCGSGEEAIILAQYYPSARVLGVDFSPRSIDLARKKSEQYSNVKFEVGDLLNNEWNKENEVFDFILCHAVADYVSDVQALMLNLSNALKTHGIIYMSVNSPHHPASRIRSALSDLGMPPSQFKDSPEQRAMLKTVVKLTGSKKDVEDLDRASKAYLDIDIFPPYAHHLSVESWEKIANNAGLLLGPSLESMYGLLHLNDAELPPLYKLNKLTLSKWMLALRKPPGMQFLLNKESISEPSFDKEEDLWTWKPYLASCLGQLPEMSNAPNTPMHLTLRFPGLPDFILYSNAYDLEVLRRCNGNKILAEIIAEIPIKGSQEQLRNTLFRAFHYGLLSM